MSAVEASRRTSRRISRQSPSDHGGKEMRSPFPRFLLTIVGSAAYLGLAILGWGGFAGFFAHPALVTLTGVFLVIAVAAFFAGGNVSPGVREDRGNRWVIATLVAI